MLVAFFPDTKIIFSHNIRTSLITFKTKMKKVKRNFIKDVWNEIMYFNI